MSFRFSSLHQRCVGVGAPGTCTVLALDYSYDGWGNLVHHGQGGGAPAAAETFVYDSLHRLEQATRNGHGTVSYQYDAVGNLKSKSDFSSGTNAYAYGSSRPHAVTAVQQAAGTRVYAYDGNGNMVGRGLNTITQELKYDSHNRPERLQFGLWATAPARTEFRYTPGGDRYLQRKRKGTGNLYVNPPPPYAGISHAEDFLILYPFPGFEVDLRRNANQNWAGYLGVRQVLGGWGMRHARNTGHLPRVLWDHRDRLGSVVARTREDGQVASRPEQLYGGATPGNGQHERFGFDAFGKPRTGSWADSGGSMGEPHPGSNGVLFSAVSLRGFTDHEHLDDEKLIHMNGRLYDPLLGRFLSVDPIIQFPENSQSLNPYSYILNNPMSGTDPTGYCSAPVGSNIRICDMEVKQIYTDGSSRSMKFNSRNEADMSRAAAVVAGAISQMLKGNGSEGQGARADAGGRSHDRMGDQSRRQMNDGLSRSERRTFDRNLRNWQSSGLGDATWGLAYEGPDFLGQGNYSCDFCHVDGTPEEMRRTWGLMSPEHQAQFLRVQQRSTDSMLMFASILPPVKLARESIAAVRAIRPLLGRNATPGRSRMNTDLPGDRATAKSIFRNQTRGQQVSQLRTQDGGIRRWTTDGTQIRMYPDGRTRLDLKDRGPLFRETIHIPPRR